MIIELIKRGIARQSTYAPNTTHLEKNLSDCQIFKKLLPSIASTRERTLAKHVFK